MSELRENVMGMMIVLCLLLHANADVFYSR